jgi:hypothetical protein
MLGGEEELTHGRTANSQQFLDSMRCETETGMWLSIARFVRPILWGAAAGCAAEVEGRKETNFELYVPEGGGGRPPAVRCPSPSSVGPPGRWRSVIPGRREQRQLAAAAAAATASGFEVHLVGEGGGRHHPHPGAAADHAVVHPGRPGGWADAAQEAVVETGHSGAAVVAERARGAVVEVADLVVVVRAAHGGEGRVAVGGDPTGGRGRAPWRRGARWRRQCRRRRSGFPPRPRRRPAPACACGRGESLVQLRRPHEARALERPGRLVAGAAPAAAAGTRCRRRTAAVDVGAARAGPRTCAPRRARPTGAVRRDVEGDGEMRRDERLRERHQLVLPQELLLLAARELAGLLLLPHGRGFSSPLPLLAPGRR